MIIDRDQNELARMLERVSDADFIRVIVAGHLKFRAPECGCDICLGKFETSLDKQEATECDLNEQFL